MHGAWRVAIGEGASRDALLHGSSSHTCITTSSASWSLAGWPTWVRSSRWKVIRNVSAIAASCAAACSTSRQTGRGMSADTVSKMSRACAACAAGPGWSGPVPSSGAVLLMGVSSDVTPLSPSAGGKGPVAALPAACIALVASPLCGPWPDRNEAIDTPPLNQDRRRALASAAVRLCDVDGCPSLCPSLCPLVQPRHPSRPGAADSASSTLVRLSAPGAVSASA